MYMLLFFFAFDVCFCHHIVLFNTQKDVRVAIMTKPKKFHIIAKDSLQTTAIDYIYNSSLICWTDIIVPQIDCALFNGTSTTNRIAYTKGDLPSPDGLACDWLTRNLYWTDKESKKIEVLSLTNKHRKVLFWRDVDQPRGIALDPLDGLMFWTDWGDLPKIERGSMDGDPESRKIIINENIYWPNSVSLDIETKKLYWLDGKLLFIEVTDYKGSNRVTLIDKGLEYPHTLSVADDKIYWTDWKTYGIYSIDRNGSKLPNEVIHFDNVPVSDIKVYDANRQPYAATPCDINNGNCSHLCLLSSNQEGYSCACPTGIKLIDGKNCAPAIENFILLVQRVYISIISLDTPEFNYVDLPLRGIKHSTAIDYDPVDQYFYWTDQEQQNIRRAKLDGSRQEIVIKTDIYNPDGIAIDWIARNIYWCDAGTNRIEMSRLNTNYRKTVIFEDLGKPRAVVVYPQQGWLFWTDWDDQKPKIERAELDGLNRKTLVKNNICWPNGLTLDSKNNKLYFGDAKTDKIEMIGIDGHGRQEILSENLGHIFSLSLLDNNLYWTDWSRRTLEVANKDAPRNNRSIILEQLHDVMGLKAVNRYPPAGTNPCAVNNGNCSHFCINKPAMKYVCACEIEYELHTDGKSCIIPESYLLIQASNRIRRMSVQSTNSDTIPITNIKSITAFDVSPIHRLLYWADNRTKSINRAFLNGTSEEKIISSGLQFPESVAIDWLSSNLYWADTNLQRIEVVKINGNYRKTLFWNNVNEPRNLVVDPRSGYMFWSEWNGEYGTIMKASMDGSAKRAIIEKTGRVTGLTIDYTQKCLYWVHMVRDEGTIEQCDDNGLNRVLKFQQNSWKPYSITQNTDYLFLTNSKNSSVTQLHKYNNEFRTLFTFPSQVSNMHVVDSVKQGGWNHCVFNNGDCKYLCLVRPGFSSLTTEAECVCPTHYTMREGICHPPDNFLLFSLRNSLYRLITNMNECPDFPLPISVMKGVRAIEYDSATKNVYWIDNKGSTIKRSAENGTSGTVSLGSNENLKIYDIALEPFSKLLFWTSSSTNSINVTRLNNSTVGCIFEGKTGQKPQNLALHPEKGLIFWTETGNFRQLVHARLDGSKQFIIDTDGQLTDALTVERRSSLLYFTYGGELYEYNIAERSKRLIYKFENKEVSSLAVTRLYLYWVNRRTNRIERVNVNVNTVTDRTVIVKQTSLITDLISVDPLDDIYPSHPCSSVKDHGNCSHLCLPSTENVKVAECGCPIHLKLSDDRQTCIIPPPSSLNYATCKLENNSMICDGNSDCIDGSDESNCCLPEYFSMDTAYFLCKDSTCILNKFVCDGLPRCPDGSDESEELCKNARTMLINEGYADDNSIQFFIAFAMLISLAAIGIYFYMKRKLDNSSNCKQEVSALRPLSNVVNYPIVNVNPVGLINSAGSMVSYERSNTGISSSTSMIHCPLNPPPSPTTTTMQQDECCCSEYQQPLPSRCSSDIGSDSFVNFNPKNLDYGFYQEESADSISYEKHVPDRINRYKQRRQNRCQRPNHDYRELPYSPYQFDYNSAPPPTPYTSGPPSPSSSIYCRPFTIPPPPPTPSNSLPDETT